MLAPPPTVEMMVRPTLLVLVITWPAVSEIELLVRVAAWLEAGAEVIELSGGADVTAFVEDAGGAAVVEVSGDAALLDAGVVGGLAAAEEGVDDWAIGGTGATRVVVCGPPGKVVVGVVPLLISPAWRFTSSTTSEF